MNQLLKQLTTSPSTEIHSAPFVGTAAENVLEWLESFNQIVTRNVWNDHKQLQVVSLYLKDTALNFYRSLPDQKNVLQQLNYTQDHVYNMLVKLHELKQGSSLEAYVNDLDNLSRHLQLPKQQKIH